MSVNILFVCIENSCRSQMAEGFAKHLAKGRINAYSAGSRPADMVNPAAVKVMQELGIDISGQYPKGFNEVKEINFDYVITMGCQDICPYFSGREHLDWHIADPKGKDIDFFRKVRDDIQEKIKSLIEIILLQ